LLLEITGVLERGKGRGIFKTIYGHSERQTHHGFIVKKDNEN
jgi:hypothetical protein